MLKMICLYLHLKECHYNINGWKNDMYSKVLGRMTCKDYCLKEWQVWINAWKNDM